MEIQEAENVSMINRLFNAEDDDSPEFLCVYHVPDTHVNGLPTLSHVIFTVALCIAIIPLFYKSGN